MEDLKSKLKIFSYWLKNLDPISIEEAGVVERMIQESNRELIYKIGDFLDEILKMDEEETNSELENWE